MAANIRRNIETSKHFLGLITKKGGDSIAVTTYINDEYLILMKGTHLIAQSMCSMPYLDSSDKELYGMYLLQQEYCRL